MTISGIIGVVGGIVAIIGCIIGVIGYFAGQKKQSNDDVAKRAHFEGVITTKLEQVLDAVEKLDAKLSKNTEELYAEVHKQIAEHEKRFHNVS